MGETIKKNEITQELENAEVLPFGKKDFNAYNRLMANIEKGFTKASEAYVLIACNLWQINRSEYFRIDSYKTIADFALEKYDMKKALSTTTSKLLRSSVKSWMVKQPVLKNSSKISSAPNL